ncbi:hypothetical protein BDZ97DRAFT_1758602 [Flammula alnicola]|nr:hypothetical protein BDZ97DRAFT_1758602 [Flammula alnicola]
MGSWVTTYLVAFVLILHSLVSHPPASWITWCHCCWVWLGQGPAHIPLTRRRGTQPQVLPERLRVLASKSNVSSNLRLFSVTDLRHACRKSVTPRWTGNHNASLDRPARRWSQFPSQSRKLPDKDQRRSTSLIFISNHHQQLSCLSPVRGAPQDIQKGTAARTNEPTPSRAPPLFEGCRVELVPGDDELLFVVSLDSNVVASDDVRICAWGLHHGLTPPASPIRWASVTKRRSLPRRCGYNDGGRDHDAMMPRRCGCNGGCSNDDATTPTQPLSPRLSGASMTPQRLIRQVQRRRCDDANATVGATTSHAAGVPGMALVLVVGAGDSKQVSTMPEMMSSTVFWVPLVVGGAFGRGKNSNRVY